MWQLSKNNENIKTFEASLGILNSEMLFLNICLQGVFLQEQDETSHGGDCRGTEGDIVGLLQTPGGKAALSSVP